MKYELWLEKVKGRYIDIDTLMSDLAYHQTEAVQLMLLRIRKSDIIVI